MSCNRGVIMVLAAMTLSAPSLARRERSFLGGEGDKVIDGRWRVVQMIRGGKVIKAPEGVAMIMTFRAADHSWEFVIKTDADTFSDGGTWTLNGTRLVTRSKDGKKVERIRVSLVGRDVLQLKKTNETLELKRI